MASTAGVIKIKQRGKPVPSTPQTSAPPVVAQPAAPAPKLKIVIRRLPATMTEQEYSILTADVINKDTVEWSTFTAGKLPQDRNKSTIYARAYCKVRDTDKIVLIKKALDGRSLTDTRGQESRVQVEFAPFQKIPRTKGRIRNDARSGTIEKDPEFLAFLENLQHTGPNAQSSAAPTVEAAEKSAGDATEVQKVYHDPLAVPTPSYDAPLVEGGTKVTSTPLLDFIKQQKLHPKIKDKGKGKAPIDDDDSKSTTSSQGGHGRKRDKDRKKRGKDKEKDKDIKPVTIMAPDKKQPKIIEKKVPATANLPVPTGPASSSTQKSPKEQAQTPKKERRERGNVGIAAAILQRDLGIATPAGRRNRKDRPTTEPNADPKAVQPSTAPVTPAATTSPDARPASEQSSAGPANNDKQRNRNRNRQEKRKEAVAAKTQAEVAAPTTASEPNQTATASTEPIIVAPIPQAQNARGGRGGRGRGGRGGRAPAIQTHALAQSQSTSTTATPSSANTDAPGVAQTSNSPAIPTGPKNMQNVPPHNGPANHNHGPPHRGRGRGFGGPFGPGRGGRGRGYRGGPHHGGNGGPHNANGATSTAAAQPAASAGGE